MDHPTGSPEAELAVPPPELIRLKSLWDGIYSITCPDRIWSAYYLRTGEEFAARSLPELRTRIRQDYSRRLEVRPGTPTHVDMNGLGTQPDK